MNRQNKHIIITALAVSLFLNGCSAGRQDKILNYQSSISEAEKMISEAVASEEAVKAEKSAEDRLKLINSTEFYGFNTEPYLAAGSGPVKPQNYHPADYVVYCEDAEITDPVLSEMIAEFTEESRKSITADFERFSAFYNFSFDIEDIADFVTHTITVNNYCIVLYQCELNSESEYNTEFYEKTGGTSRLTGIFSLRCAYFDISGRKRLELSDLFFSGYDFTSAINSKVQKSMEYTGRNSGFQGLNKEFMTLFPSHGLYFRIEKPMLTPYPDYTFCSQSDKELLSECCIYSETVKFGTDIYKGETCVRDIRDYVNTEYGTDDKYPGMINVPLKSALYDDETLDAVKKKTWDDIGEYIHPDPLTSDDSADSILCALYLDYLMDYNIFHAHIGHHMEHCRLAATQKYYDSLTLEELSADDLLTRVIAENWQDYFETDLSEYTTDYIEFRDELTDTDTLIRIFGVLNKSQNHTFCESREIIYHLKDGKWIPEPADIKEN